MKTKTENQALRVLLATTCALALGCSSTVGTTRTSADQPSADAQAVGGEDIDLADGDEHSPTRVVVGLRDVGTDTDTMMQIDPSVRDSALYFRMSSLEDVCDDISILFEYDSDELTPETIGELDELTRCFHAEEIRSIEIAGHADPRGSHDYNDDLALRRARRVAAYLRDRGVTEPEVEVVSHGEERARWRAHWANDRRVDIDSEPAEDHD